MKKVITSDYQRDTRETEERREGNAAACRRAGEVAGTVWQNSRFRILQ